MGDFNDILAAAFKAAEEEKKNANKHDAMEYCKVLWELYSDLQTVGFSESQAFQLVCSIAM